MRRYLACGLKSRQSIVAVLLLSGFTLLGLMGSGCSKKEETPPPTAGTPTAQTPPMTPSSKPGSEAEGAGGGPAMPGGGPPK